MLTLVPRASDPAWTRLDAGSFSGRNGGIGGASSNVASGGSTVLLAGSTGQALDAQPTRACLILQNNSAVGGPVLWYDFGQPAVENQSFSLQPQAGLVIANPDACPKEAVYVTISGSGTFYGKIYENALPQKMQQQVSATAAAAAWGIEAAPQLVTPAPAETAPATPRARRTAAFRVA